MSAKVVPLTPDGAIAGEPRTPLVEELERLLESARSGHMQGMIYAVANRDETWGTGWSGGAGTRHLLSSGLLVLNHRYGQALHEE